ncbi:MAG: peptidoglycan-binding protein [bacterium]
MEDVRKSFLRFALAACAIIAIFSVAQIAFAYTYSGVLQLGSTGSSVTSLQSRLGISPTTGNFDYATRAAVVTFQLSKGLSADGVVGPATGRALEVTVVKPVPAPAPSPQPIPAPTPSPYPAGCASSSGYSSTTGKPCNGTPVQQSPYQAGCTSTYGFSITTGISCSIPVGCDSRDGYSSVTGLSCDGPAYTTPLPQGCTSRQGYSATTGAACINGVTTAPLRGPRGTLEHVAKAAGYEGRKISEHSTNAYFAGYVLTGEEFSDIRITGFDIGIEFAKGDASASLGKYAKNINVLANGTKVGTVDVANMSKDGDTYTAKIPLYGAVLRSNQATYFYLSADTEDNISKSNADNTWTITLEQIRYMDGLGNTHTDSSRGDIGADGATEFHFQPIDN